MGELIIDKLFFCYSQPKRFFTKHPADVIVSAKKPKSRPVTNDASKPDAARSTSTSTRAASTVPKTPASNAVNEEQRQFSPSFLQMKGAMRSEIARKPSATPNKIQSTNCGTAILAEKLRKAATMPVITLAITAIIVQSHFVLQQQIFMLSPPLTSYAMPVLQVTHKH